MTPVFGLDASFSLVNWAAVLPALVSRPRVFVQCLWTGGYAGYQALQRVAEANLRGAREAGLVTAGYINASPWYPQQDGLARAMAAAGAEWVHLQALAVDVEIDGLTLAQVRELAELCASTGKRTCIYTGEWFWRRIGDPQDAWLRQFPLWYARYDGVANLEPAGFGPPGWQVVGKQFAGTTTIGGAQFDLNVFDLEWWQGGDSMPDPMAVFDQPLPLFMEPPEQAQTARQLLGNLVTAVLQMDGRLRALEERLARVEAQKGGECRCCCCTRQ